jgi:hypothetical protein
VPNQLCPLCRKAYDPDDCIQKCAAERASKKSKRKGKTGVERSPKLQALLDAIDEMAADEKACIFSQASGCLDALDLFSTLPLSLSLIFFALYHSPLCVCETTDYEVD